ncbi:placenta growth factor isoform X2 [Lates calcarifer]|uniref:Placenta growth factor isoform X2 n=1 Tax=Lates calcarifer TaxID=8187 RepID=A0AAJ7Q3C9_LATCA|nr:placenta growth factor isoform X2 [Lates calcarifer]
MLCIKNIPKAEFIPWCCFKNQHSSVKNCAVRGTAVHFCQRTSHFEKKGDASTVPLTQESLPLANINSTTEVLMFQEVWGRSFCRTIEKLVEVVQEYPTEVEYIYSPSCVPLVRCAGCCGDENLECHPTHTTNVTMQLLKIRPSEPGQEYVEMTFVEHQTCECRIRKPVAKIERRRQRGRGRKRKDRQKTKECERCQNPRR